MRRAMDETARRRAKQIIYNTEHGIVPVGIVKDVADIMEGARTTPGSAAAGRGKGRKSRAAAPVAVPKNLADLGREIRRLEERMYAAARNLEFEQAAALRDQLDSLRQLELEVAEPIRYRSGPST
jgi:excinuclease ABC subunit B